MVGVAPQRRRNSVPDQSSSRQSKGAISKRRIRTGTMLFSSSDFGSAPMRFGNQGKVITKQHPVLLYHRRFILRQSSVSKRSRWRSKSTPAGETPTRSRWSDCRTPRSKRRRIELPFAFCNSGLRWPYGKRITINLAPADVRKEGPSF